MRKSHFASRGGNSVGGRLPRGCVGPLLCLPAQVDERHARSQQRRGQFWLKAAAALPPAGVGDKMILSRRLFSARAYLLNRRAHYRRAHCCGAGAGGLI